MKAAAAAAEAAKRKQAEEAATAALAKKQKEQAMMVGSLESDLNMCKSQMANAVAKANGLAECKHSLAEFQLHSVAIDRRLRPFFGNYSVEVVTIPLLTLASVLFWLIGCFIGKARVTPMVNPSGTTSGVVISEVIIRPGNEVCVIKNRTFNDVVSRCLQIRWRFRQVGLNMTNQRPCQLNKHAGPNGLQPARC